VKKHSLDGASNNEVSLGSMDISGNTYKTRQQAKAAIFEYIEGFYNRQRRHSYLGYLSPDQYEKKNVA
jgi:transposase InsO family protein